MRSAIWIRLSVSIAGCVVWTGCSGAIESGADGVPEEAPIAQCRDRDPLRRAFFGDLHVHTSYSMDANMFGTRADPNIAYRFARGEAVTPTIDGPDGPARLVQLERPLDFAAVTDHAENIGAVALCTELGSPRYDTEGCRIYRGDGPLSLMRDFSKTVNEVVIRQQAASSLEVCGVDRIDCIAATTDPWRKTVAAAERFQDRSAACDFTAFPAYEFSYTPQVSKIHRNVIFRNEHVTDYPVSAEDVEHPRDLWRHLRDECLQSDTGCDVLAIPHNSNLSDGRMFFVEYGGATSIEDERAYAALRAEIEPLVEIMQIKGDSECKGGLWGVSGEADEFCGFEKFRDFPRPPPDCEGGTGQGALMGAGCASKLDFARYALVEGLKEAERLGVNPYAFGFVASTDIHDATPGNVDEWVYDGLRRKPMNLRNNPGGLAGIWAEENSRDALFDAMRRREVFATSGPRIEPRLFAGWDFPGDICDRHDLVGVGYAAGVPMGSELPPIPAGTDAASSSPVFVARAAADPGTPLHPGTPLQRIQVVKGWVGADGSAEQQVFDVAGGANAADVDLDSCEPRGAGAASLCGVWRDPDFDATQRAVYYARILENPSCRYHVRQCANAPAGQRDSLCDDPRLPKTIQERAWTSPIWYTPAS